MAFQQETVDDILPWIDENIGLPLQIQDVAARPMAADAAVTFSP